MSRRRKAINNIQLPIPWWITLFMALLSLAIAVIILDFRVVSKVTQFGEIMGEALGTPVDFAPLLVSLKPLLLIGILILWLGTFTAMKKYVSKVLTVPF